MADSGRSNAEIEFPGQAATLALFVDRGFSENYQYTTLRPRCIDTTLSEVTEPDSVLVTATVPIVSWSTIAQTITTNAVPSNAAVS